MDPVKIGNFIKKLRKDNNLTQKELADKYSVTYQAVSKWENGINLPDVTLLREMSKDFNISVEDILDGEVKTKKKNNIKYIIIGILIIIIIGLFIFFINNYNKSFDFKTITASCEQFKVSGSIAYDKNKSSIYISHIDYCGGDDNLVYDNIECSLYESNNNSITKISSCEANNNVSLEDYLKNVEFKVDNYKQVCSDYNDNTLYLEINAVNKNNKVTTYKIPLSLNSNC